MKTIEERFWQKVDRSGECWTWTAKSKSAFGYGLFRIGGRQDGRLLLAHRVSWELANGPIPDGLCVLHDCDNPPCVNPAHLHLGTKADNARERVERGRATSWTRGRRKTCRRGHDDWNEQPSGRRYCRTCAREASLRWQAENPTYQRDWARARRARE